MSNPVPLKALPVESSRFDIEKFKALYRNFDKDTSTQLPNLYSQDIQFKDPLHETKGLETLKVYFAGFCSPNIKCRFNFHNQLVTEDQAFVQWQMQYSHTRLNNGELLTLNGGTLIKFTNLIYYHEDFYDMGAMIYQHVPILGWAIRKINNRMADNK
jgi:hypothetical protein